MSITNHVSVFTNLNLDTNKICTSHFFEKHSNYCSTHSMVNKYHLTKSDLKPLCKLRVSYVISHPFVIDVRRTKNPGVMVSFLNTYQQKRKVKVHFTKSNDVYQEEFLFNGTFHRLKRDLSIGKHDIAIGHLFMNSTTVVPFDYGPLFFNDSLHLVTRKRKRITNYKKLVVVFQTDLWNSYLLTFLIVTLSYFFITQLVDHKFGILSTLLNVFRISLGVGLNILPKSWSLRLLFAFYSLFCINIDSIYLAKLSMIFLNAPYDVIVTDVGELLRSGTAFQYSWFIERLGKLTYVAHVNYQKSLFGGSQKVNWSEADVLKLVRNDWEVSKTLV